MGWAILVSFKSSSWRRLRLPIPSELGNLSLLQELLLHQNKLTGPIPSELGLMSTMGWLGLNNNSLSGAIPLELSELEPSLYSLHLSDNPSLSGTIPDALCTLGGTCFDGLVSLKPCHVDLYGATYDCSPQLCGCSCPSCATRSSSFGEQSGWDTLLAAYDTGPASDQDPSVQPPV